MIDDYMTTELVDPDHTRFLSTYRSSAYLGSAG